MGNGSDKTEATARGSQAGSRAGRARGCPAGGYKKSRPATPMPAGGLGSTGLSGREASLFGVPKRPKGRRKGVGATRTGRPKRSAASRVSLAAKVCRTCARLAAATIQRPRLTAGVSGAAP